MRDMMELAQEAARAGGKTLKQKLEHVRPFKLKGERDLVTEGDLASEEKIVPMIRKAFPSHSIVSEESPDLQTAASAEFQWFVDPLDGTTNFAHGFPEFAVSIGLAHMGKVILGVVYKPVHEELFYARVGHGAFLNGRRITVSEVPVLAEALLATGFPYDMKTEKEYNFDHFMNLERRVQAIRRLGSASLDLAYVACGRFDSYWESKLAPWDMAAGVILVAEAGGVVTDFLGKPFSLSGGQIVASNPKIHSKVLKVLSLGRSGMTGENPGLRKRRRRRS
jgi:myo-inositol-1(or 4)-monophosphatase